MDWADEGVALGMWDGIVGVDRGFYTDGVVLCLHAVPHTLVEVLSPKNAIIRYKLQAVLLL